MLKHGYFHAGRVKTGGVVADQAVDLLIGGVGRKRHAGKGADMTTVADFWIALRGNCKS